MARQVNIRVTGGIASDDYESFIAKITETIGEYGLELEENYG